MRLSYKKQFFKLYRKKSLQDIPRLFAILLVVALLAVAAYMVLIQIYGENVGKITIAYVTEEEDFSLRAQLKYIARNSNCEFQKYDAYEAVEALDEKKVAGILEVGENKTISFSYYDDDEFLTYLFGDMIQAGITDYLVINAATDSLEASNDSYSKNELKDFKNELTDILIYRNSNYDRIVYSDTGDVPLKFFYAGTVVALLELSSLAVIIGFLKRDEENFLIFTRRIGISLSDVFVARYTPIALIYLGLTFISSLLFQLFFIGAVSFINLFAALIATLVLTVFVILIHELIGNNIYATLGALSLSAIAMFLSGCIVPLSYLPSGIKFCSRFLPTKYASRLFGQVFFDRLNFTTLIIAASYLGILILITLTIIYLKEKVSRNEAD